MDGDNRNTLMGFFRYQKLRLKKSYYQTIKMLSARRSYSVLISSFLTLLRLKPSNKVFVVGLNKTGTSSIHKLLSELGYHSDHSVMWTRSPYSLRLMMFDAFSDGFPRYFDKLDRLFPNSKFILNVRDLDNWLDSRLNHLEFKESIGPNFKGKGIWRSDDDAVRKSILMRNEHHLRVLWHFAERPENLLVVNFVRDPDAAQKIAAFLGIDRTVEKPHAHPIPKKRDQSKLRFQDKIIKSFNDLNIPEAEWSNDLFCPSLVENPASLNWVPDTSMRVD